MNLKKRVLVERVIKVGNLEHKEYLAHPTDTYFHPDKEKATLFSDKQKAQEAIDNILSKWYKNSERKPMFNILEE